MKPFIFKVSIILMALAVLALGSYLATFASTTTKKIYSKTNPADIFLANKMALSYWLKNEDDKAAQMFRKIISGPTRPSSQNYKILVQAYLFLAMNEKNNGNSEEYIKNLSGAIHVLQTISDENPGTRIGAAANYKAAIFELMVGRLDEAEKRAIFAQESQYYNAEGHLLQGLIFENKGMLDQAKSKYEAIIRLFPDVPIGEISKKYLTNIGGKPANINHFFEWQDVFAATRKPTTSAAEYVNFTSQES